MAQAKHEVFKIEIQDAVLQGLKNLLNAWQNENANALEPQRWRAVVDYLGDTAPIDLFCNDSGLERQVTYDWVRGQRLPSAEMCALYLNLLMQKIVDYQAMQRNRKEQLLNPPEVQEKKESKDQLPKETVIEFELPDGMNPETPLEEIGNYLSLSVRIRNCLKNSNIVQAGDLLKPSKGRTWKIFFLLTPNFGKVSTARLYHFLVENGFKPVLGE